MLHTYNCSKHDTAGYVPYFLMFGPIHVFQWIWSTEVNRKQLHHQLCCKITARLQEAYKLATAMSRDIQTGQKKGYDCKVRSIILTEGARVLVCV